MISLRTLGAIDLHAADGRELSTLLAQPKRMALLIYLAVARPHGFHRRDRLVALFWPESEQARARQALSKAVHHLRRVLGDDALISRGDDDLSLNDLLIECDARQLDQALVAGDHARAVELYRGDLAGGLFIDDAPDLEHWLDDERSRLRQAVAAAAGALADDALSHGQAATAVEHARQAAALLPDDEPLIRRVMRACVAAGDRAGALRAYEAFAARLRAELDSEPSADTRELAQSIRHRERAPIAPRAPSKPPPLVRQAEAAPPATPVVAPPTVAQRGRWRRPAAVAFFTAAVLVIAASVRGRTAERSTPPASPQLHENRVLVAVLDNRTGDSTLDAVGTMAMDFMTQGISSAALIEVVDPSGAVLAARGVDTLRGQRVDPARMARALAIESGAGLVISGAYYREGDSLRFRVSLSDVTRSTVARSFQLVSAHVTEPTAALSDLRRQAIEVIAEAVEPRLLEFSRSSAKPPSYPAYQEYVRGIDLYTHRQEQAAFPHFVRAFELDTSFTLALLNASVSAITAQDDRVDKWIDTLDKRRATLPRLQQVWLDSYLAFRAGNREEMHRLMGELSRLAPGSMWPYLHAIGTYERGQHHRARDLLLAIDPERGWMKGWFTYWPMRGMVRHTLGEHEAEAADADSAYRRFPGNVAAITMQVRALTVLGRRADVERKLDEAILAPPTAGWNAGSAIGVTALEAGAHGHADWIPWLRERALQWYDALPEEERESEAPVFGHSWVLYAVGAWPELAARLDRLEREIPPRPELLAYRAMVVARAGDRARALAIDSALQTGFRLEEASNAMERYRARDATYRSAQVAAALGDRGRALEQLRRAAAGGGVPRFYLHCEPVFAGLRSDPEFRQLFATRD